MFFELSVLGNRYTIFLVLSVDGNISNRVTAYANVIWILYLSSLNFQMGGNKDMIKFV